MSFDKNFYYDALLSPNSIENIGKSSAFLLFSSWHINLNCFLMFFFWMFFNWTCDPQFVSLFFPRSTSSCAKFWRYFLHHSSVHIYTLPKWQQIFVMHLDSHWAYALVIFALDNRLSILPVFQLSAISLFAHKIHKLCNGKWNMKQKKKNEESTILKQRSNFFEILKCWCEFSFAAW